MKTKTGIVIVAVLTSALLTAQGRVNYPQTRKVDQVDDYFGTKVADPYRWLEDLDSADTATWVAAQNTVTNAYLESIPERAPIKRRLTELWNYERYGVPSKEGRYYVFSKNDGLQNQSVIYKSTSLAAAPQVLLDPNTLSSDGTVALASAAFSDDGRYMAYSLAASGSDWIEWRVRDVAAARDLPDVIKNSKFSDAAWKEDGSGFFYNRYDVGGSQALATINKNQKLYFHRVGTVAEKDEVVYERPDKPDWMWDADVTDDGRFLVVYQSEGTDPKVRVFVRDLTAPGGALEPMLDAYDASYQVIGNDGDRLYVYTDKDAPRYRVVAIDRRNPKAAWQTILPEPPGRDVLADVSMIANRFVAVVRTDAHEKVKVYALNGRFERDIALPTIGSVGGVKGRRSQNEGFYAFTSFTYPTTVFRYDFSHGTNSVFRKPAVAFHPEEYETSQVFYRSKDGTRVPMFISHRKGVARDGSRPTILYGYGGFFISTSPSFSAANLHWMEMGGIYASANLRGGSEYGKEWHDGGRLQNKQNVFDDFIAAAEYLIAEKYTSTPKLAISGGSNGGLLVGAVLNQRPELFGAALPAVGVMDMLRFHRFTIGWAWTSDYGSSETKDGFDTLIKYSPLHNIRPGTKYPPTLITTADHDDRVVPAHSFKYAATLQAAQAGDAPILIRIETKAGHGAGKPTTKRIEERTDVVAFLVRALDMKVPAAVTSPNASR